MEEGVRFKQELLEKEYGSNIRGLSEYVADVKDKSERTAKTEILVKLIEKMHPSVKYAEDYKNKILGDIYLMSGERLDVDIDFEKPNMEKFLAKPQKVAYNQQSPRYKHYGRNIELLISKLGEQNDKEVIDHSVEGMGKLMKTFYTNWNKENVDDGVIANQMEKLSDGKISVDRSKLGDSLSFDSQRSSGKRDYNNTNNKNGGKRNNRNNKRKKSN